MQFQNPEIFYFLPVLLIPIIIHLFQLQKFEKVPFTNVAFLQRILQENRKSSTLKKWLILTTRLLLLLAILFAFSQPYFSNKSTTEKQHTFIYLDNSISTTAIGERGNLLKIAAQNIIENASENDEYSLLTNSNYFEDITYEELKKQLLSVKNTGNTSDFKSVILKIKEKNKNKTNTLYKNILISDFQYNYENLFTNVTGAFSVVQLFPSIKNNISIDSVFTKNTSLDKLVLNVILNNTGNKKENIPIAIYDNNKLLNKQTFSIEENSKQTIVFELQNTTQLKGKIAISFSDTFSFDNTFYFTIKNTKKVAVLSIGKKYDFYNKIYTGKEFSYKYTSLQNLNYNSIQNQDLIILNELTTIPNILTKPIYDFVNKGGSLVVVPNSKTDINSYNNFFSNFSSFRITSKQKDTLKITDINFEHPIFKNVFSKRVSNFQYPRVNEMFTSNSKGLNSIISLENNKPFIGQINTNNKNIYWVTSSLLDNVTNFTKSPLIVPVFYNFGKLSYKNSQLYYRLGKTNTVDVEVKLNKDEIVTVSGANNNFIPQQRTYQNKVNLIIENQPENSGFYNVLKSKDTIQKLAFNMSKNESSLNFFDFNTIENKNNSFQVYSSVSEVFSDLNKKNEVHWLWKWFLTLAIVSLLLEIFILKFYKS